MSARVLVVDDVLPNVRLLEAKLGSEYFDVVTAMDGPSALARMAEQAPDIVLLDVMMPGMDGFEVCRRIRKDPKTAHIPVVMVTALSDAEDRVRGLEAGADDFLTKPVNDLALFARVRSLVRLKMMMDELRLREQTTGDLGVLADPAALDVDSSAARVIVLEDSAIESRKMCDALTNAGNVVIPVTTTAEANAAATSGPPDLFIVSLGLRNEDGLRFCSHLRSNEATRHLPILLVISDSDIARLAKGLDIGVNDYIARPYDRNELLARVRTQVRRRRFQDRLRHNYQRGLELALTDSLTGIYNRRYMATHLPSVMKQAADAAKPLALFMIDIDHFKRVNDTYGHPMGDEVLRAVARRIADAVRQIDTVARMGGEEFLVVMPDARADIAVRIAERLRQAVADDSVADPRAPGGKIAVTISIGVALANASDTGDTLIQRADQALYRAKQGGRNRVECEEQAAPVAVAAGR
ncbi:MAG: PleD family two-component system response regulator [Alphaproteobacteria bacterium]|nr:PleD family two-component system response regulator [Alphaproteobacteria bacterium]